VVGRFAPSPTGPLHLGSLRTALAAWLFAHAAGGRCLLRIEDLDPDRSRAEFEEVQLGQLADLGLSWDGPVIHQSDPDRQAAYGEALARLPTYPCFCTRAELAERPCPCRSSPPPGRIRSALRVDAGGERIGFSDGLAGPQCGAVDDFVVRRADGVYAYGLAVVVDDAFQRVDQVVRGADLLSSTPRQIWLARALGLAIPRYHHVPLVMGPDGRRLAKRHGSTVGVTEPLAWLGRSLGIPGAEGARSAADLLPGFDPRRIPAGPVSAG
jgi:glutamyl-tRNA synthetase